MRAALECEVAAFADQVVVQGLGAVGAAWSFVLYIVTAAFSLGTSTM
jgi:hypothetical protein